ncbi:gram-negative porin family protein [Collimonas fungivorans]|uniref:Gram-negative porin family protein n=1 Tax=Collimonas fungivorans TaxID=158899 RepID=A0A127PBS6_9BURK|nr:porin [Collimonas fungivorans]AMO95228.1 gram-negative porin family protein [Collimonas fungivorans]
MKKKFVAACSLAGCSALAHAEPNVTLYGDLDQYLGYIHSSSGKSVTGLNDGAILRSRLGLRGVEELGGGYQTRFTLEQGLNANTGGAADSSRLFDRQAWVGMTTPAGEFRIGRQNTIVFFIGGAIDYTERTTYGSVINTFGVPSRYDNDISYKSPRVAGFQFDAHYALTESAGESIGARGVYQFGLDYSQGPYRAGYAGLWAKPAANAQFSKKVVYHNLYANYDYGKGKLYFAYVRSNNVTSNASGNTAAAILNNVSIPGNAFTGANADVQRMYNIYQVSADYRLSPQWRIGALYGVMQDTSHRDSGAQGGNFGTYYDLSKRTTLYGFASYMKNDANAGFRFSGSAGPTANLAGADINGKSLAGLQAGILHRF